MLKAFNDTLERIVLAIGVMCLVGFVVCVVMEVFNRALIGQSFIWSQDAATILFLWSVFVVAPVAFRHDAHLQITLFRLDPDSWPGKTHRLLLLAVNIGFAGAYCWLTWLALTAGLGRVNAATGWPLEIGWSSMLIMAVVSICFITERFLRNIPIEASSNPESPLAQGFGSAD